MPFTSDDGTGRQARFERDGSISSWGGREGFERLTPEPRERKEPRETEYREIERREVDRKELTGHSKPEKILSSSNSDPNVVLKNLSQSMTGKSLVLGGATALGCIVGELSPEPLSKAAGVGVCLMGSVAAAGTALSAHKLEPKEPQK